MLHSSITLSIACLIYLTTNGATISPNCTNQKTGLECSERGVCIGGECTCEVRENPEEVIYGETCECDNFSCPRHRGQPCGGHGVCSCGGQCHCRPGWTNKDCSCRNSTDSCVNPSSSDKEVCSGHGDCSCGKCDCHSDRYGKYCESNEKFYDYCSQYKNCVLCAMYKKGPLTQEGCQKCNFIPKAVDEITVNEENGETMCAFYDENDCRFIFVYWFDDDQQLQVRAKEEKECPKTCLFFSKFLSHY